MLWFHPFLQICATFIGVYAAFLGMARFASLHIGMDIPFKWKLHVKLGSIAIALWLLGMAGGWAVLHFMVDEHVHTGTHFQIAMVMLPLMLIGGATGLYMDRNKAKRKLLPLVHGLCNLLVVGLALYQIRTGWHVIKTFVL